VTLDSSTSLILALRHGLEVLEELPQRGGASERAVHCGVGHFAEGDALTVTSIPSSLLCQRLLRAMVVDVVMRWQVGTCLMG